MSFYEASIVDDPKGCVCPCEKKRRRKTMMGEKVLTHNTHVYVKFSKKIHYIWVGSKKYMQTCLNEITVRITPGGY